MFPKPPALMSKMVRTWQEKGYVLFFESTSDHPRQGNTSFKEV
jgi:hypothetical protein